MIYAEIKQDGTLHQVWRGIDDPDFRPPLLPGSILVSWPDGTDVRPGMIWDGSQLLPPPPPPLADIKAHAKQQVIAFLDRITSRFENDRAYPKAEREAWPTKLEAARAYIAKTADQMQIDMLSTEAFVLGITVDEIAQKIIANATRFAKVNALIAGLRQKAFAQIDAATDQNSVEDVVAQIEEDAKAAINELLSGTDDKEA